MKTVSIMLAALLSGLCVSGCSSTPTPQTDPGSVPDKAANNRPTRSTPVVAERPARMYVWAGFNEKDCTPITPTLAVAQAPTKGEVSFRPNQMTTIQHSSSGKCLGHRLPGTGIYYTARKGQTGLDQFSVTATTKSGQAVTNQAVTNQAVTKSFQVQIVE